MLSSNVSDVQVPPGEFDNVPANKPEPVKENKPEAPVKPLEIPKPTEYEVKIVFDAASMQVKSMSVINNIPYTMGLWETAIKPYLLMIYSNELKRKFSGPTIVRPKGMIQGLKENYRKIFK